MKKMSWMWFRVKMIGSCRGSNGGGESQSKTPHDDIMWLGMNNTDDSVGRGENLDDKKSGTVDDPRSSILAHFVSQVEE